MYIFGYFFQKGHFLGSSKKRAHWQKTLGWGGTDDPPALSAPESLQNCATTHGNSKTKNQDPWKFHMIFCD